MRRLRLRTILNYLRARMEDRFAWERSQPYKWLLARMLSLGLRANRFGYDPRQWPPLTPARAYIRDFLARYMPFVSEPCAEFNPPYYRPMVLATRRVRAENYDVIDLEPGPGVTVVADIHDARSVPSDKYGTILCTHVLPFLPRPWDAVRELHRILKPGGLLLVTVAASHPLARDPQDCWRLLPDGLAELLRDFSKVEIHSYGNAATMAGSAYFLMTYHFPRRLMQTHDERFPLVVAAAAWK